MAILAITNTYLYHVESLSDLTGLGTSNSNVTGDTIAWVEGLKAWYYPTTISTSSSTWVMSSFQNTGAVGTEVEQLSSSQQDTVTAGTSNQLVTTLATLATNGLNTKIIVKVTAVDDAVDTNFIAYTYEQYFYRQTGTVSSVGTFDNQQNAVGTGEFTSNVAFNVTAVGDDIRLRITNGSSTVGYTLNIAYLWTRQVGGL
jgi:hypothetical protein